MVFCCGINASLHLLVMVIVFYHGDCTLSECGEVDERCPQLHDEAAREGYSFIILNRS